VVNQPLLTHNDPTTGISITKTAPQTVIPAFLCPSSSLRPFSGVDSAGYGYTDYGPTVYTDIDPTTGVRNRFTRMDGALRAINRNASITAYTGSNTTRPTGGPNTRIGDIRDGLSKTTAIAEDVGRFEGMVSPYADALAPGVRRGFWRWAEPDNGFGVSGNPLLTATNGLTGIPDGPDGGSKSKYVAINNNKFPFGGPINCSWITGASDGNNNCGPNDEIFSFHGAGANVLFMDGHVTFLSERINPITIRYLVTAAEGVAPDIADQ
jgi:prepilin-type processing-associated H-X9-DG protein